MSLFLLLEDQRIAQMEVLLDDRILDLRHLLVVRHPVAFRVHHEY